MKFHQFCLSLSAKGWGTLKLRFAHFWKKIKQVRQNYPLIIQCDFQCQKSLKRFKLNKKSKGNEIRFGIKEYGRG